MRPHLLLLAVILASCGGNDSPSSPPAPPACQANNTADVTFQNRSTTGITMDVVLDGVLLETLTPGQTGLTRPVSAGVVHTIVFKNDATAAVICSGTPNLAQCSPQLFFCPA
jgi:hypothetical protein